MVVGTAGKRKARLTATTDLPSSPSALVTSTFCKRRLRCMCARPRAQYPEHLGARAVRIDHGDQPLFGGGMGVQYPIGRDIQPSAIRRLDRGRAAGGQWNLQGGRSTVVGDSRNTAAPPPAVSRLAPMSG